MELEKKKLSLNDLNQIVVIGQGSFSKVILVETKHEGKVYAMKVLKKKFIQLKKQEMNVIIERNILIGNNHPFIIKLYHCFQNKKKIFFLLEYCPGGQFFGLMQQRGRLPQSQVKFYSAQIILALQYLHQKNILYRDLKPENLLIDEQGYLKLTDFGLSKILVQNKPEFAVCGTPEYLAPEILLKTGHGKPVDWWCFGSLIYEMLFGLPPFYTNSRIQLSNNIKFAHPKFPSSISTDLRDLLTQLLRKNPEERLGSKYGADEIKQHPWFCNLNFDQIFRKELKSPYVPMLQNKLDVHNIRVGFTKILVQSPSEGSSAPDNENKYIDFQYDKSGEFCMIDVDKGCQLQLKISDKEENSQMEIENENM